MSEGPAVPPPAQSGGDDAGTGRRNEDHLVGELERLRRTAEELRSRLSSCTDPAERARLTFEQDAVADALDAVADGLDREADGRDRAAEARDTRALSRDRAAADRVAEQGVPDVGALDRHHAAVARDWAASDRYESRTDRKRASQARRTAADERRAAATQRDEIPTEDHPDEE